MSPDINPRPYACTVILGRYAEKNLACPISMDFNDQEHVREWLDKLRPVLHPDNWITIYRTGIDEPIIEEGFPFANRAPCTEDTGSMLPVSEDLKAEIGDCRMMYRNAYGTVLEPSRLILDALIRYRHDLEHVAGAKHILGMDGDDLHGIIRNLEPAGGES